jgi:hypothetical protein
MRRVGFTTFRESRGKVRAERLQVGQGGVGVLVAFIEVADLSIITDCPLVISAPTSFLWVASTIAATRVCKSSNRPRWMASSSTQYTFSIIAAVQTFLSKNRRVGGSTGDAGGAFSNLSIHNSLGWVEI